MKQFNLEEYLKNKSRKVVTRDGRTVKIVCTDSPIPKRPICGFVEGDIGITTWRSDGKFTNLIDSYDLSFADEEKSNSIIDEFKSYLENTAKEQIEKDWKEIQDWYNQHCADESNNEEQLTEFEKEIKNWMTEFLLGTEQSVPNEIVKKASQKVLDLARKELEKDIEHSAVEFAKSYMEDVNPSLEKVQESEELWKWKMSCLRGINKAYTQGKADALKDLPKWKKVDVFVSDLYGLTQRADDLIITHNGYQIKFSDLETLPKEE